MTQSDCLALPSHVTYLGVCYPSWYLSIGLSSANNPQSVTFSVGPTSVPEPQVPALLVAAMAALFVARLLEALRR